MKRFCWCLCLCTLMLPLALFSQAHAADKAKSGPVDCSSLTDNGRIKVDSIKAGTADALACEWMNPKAADHVLNALEFLTSSTAIPFELNIKVLCELGDPIKVDHEPVCKVIDGVPAYDGLYRAAMGDPDADGRPTVQGLPDFVDTLAKANTLNLKKSTEGDLFGCTQDLLDAIFNSESGKLDLLTINDSFSYKAKYLALYQLLRSFKIDGAKAKACSKDVDRLHALEFFRAAFEMNTQRLADQVAAKVAPPKE